jgi:hypothetical protein
MALDASGSWLASRASPRPRCGRWSAGSRLRAARRGSVAGVEGTDRFVAEWLSGPRRLEGATRQTTRARDVRWSTGHRRWTRWRRHDSCPRPRFGTRCTARTSAAARRRGGPSRCRVRAAARSPPPGSDCPALMPVTRCSSRRSVTNISRSNSGTDAKTPSARSQRSPFAAPACSDGHRCPGTSRSAEPCWRTTSRPMPTSRGGEHGGSAVSPATAISGNASRMPLSLPRRCGRPSTPTPSTGGGHSSANGSTRLRPRGEVLVMRHVSTQCRLSVRVQPAWTTR